MFGDFALQCGYRHSAYIAYREDGGGLTAQSEPFDVTVKLPHKKNSGFQCRSHEIVSFDGNENGLETHGGHQSEYASPAGSRVDRK
jgi:hypothetical protein